MATHYNLSELESLNDYVNALADEIDAGDKGSADNGVVWPDAQWKEWLSDFSGYYVKCRLGNIPSTFALDLGAWRLSANAWWSLARRSGVVRRAKDTGGSRTKEPVKDSTVPPISDEDRAQYLEDLEGLNNYSYDLDDELSKGGGIPDKHETWDQAGWKNWLSKMSEFYAKCKKGGWPSDFETAIDVWCAEADRWWDLARRSGAIAGGKKPPAVKEPVGKNPPASKKAPPAVSKSPPTAKEPARKKVPNRSKPWIGLMICGSALVAAILSSRR
jgi:hypothetical protein